VTAPVDNIDRALQLMMRRAPHLPRMRFSAEGGRGVSTARLSDEELVRDLKICVILTSPDCTPPERITSEQRTRLYDYAHILRDEINRRKEAS
jgi:hypothetical protein